jgi:hypothetical protein
VDVCRPAPARHSPAGRTHRPLPRPARPHHRRAAAALAERDEAAALQRLAVAEFPGGEEEARAEFLDAIAQLERQTAQQRIDDLLARQVETALVDEEKQELRELLAGKAGWQVRQRG